MNKLLIAVLLCVFVLSASTLAQRGGSNKGKFKLPTIRPTLAPTKAPKGKATISPTLPKATISPTLPKATVSPTKPPTQSPTIRPTTAPTKSANKATITPTKVKATVAPTKALAPTAVPNNKAGSGTGCSAKPKLLVPLYTYPGESWDAVVAGASKVETVAIINPNSGPGLTPDASYKTYMTKMDNAGVSMVGYVYTSYGARPIAAVKADINIYATEFPLVEGIFLDETAATDDKLAYYQELHKYIMSLPGYKHNIINPGTATTAGYVDAATMIVAYENNISQLTGASTPKGASCATKEKYAAIAYGATAATMELSINNLLDKQFYGYVYVTDRIDICCIYNTLAPYYGSMATYVGSK